MSSQKVWYFAEREVYFGQKWTDVTEPNNMVCK